MSDQYEVLGKAPGPNELNKLSPDNIHLTINKLSAGYGKMEILHDLDLFVSKAQSLCLIGPNGAGKTSLLEAVRRLSDSYTPGNEPVEFFGGYRFFDVVVIVWFLAL